MVFPVSNMAFSVIRHTCRIRSISHGVFTILALCIAREPSVKQMPGWESMIFFNSSMDQKYCMPSPASRPMVLVSGWISFMILSMMLTGSTPSRGPRFLLAVPQQ